MSTSKQLRLVYIERQNLERGAREECAARTMALLQDIEPLYRTRREILKTRVTNQTLCVGSLKFILAAFQSAGIKAPLHVPYPASLHPYLHRQVGWCARLRDVATTCQFPVFIKPARGWKKWRGRVVYDLQGFGGSQPVYWSEPVKWVSEWRAYVVNGHVLDTQPADEAASQYSPDLDAIERAAWAFYEAEKVAGTTLDFGVTESGATTLIEVNDGFAFGAYGKVNSPTLWKVWAARWAQLLGEDT